MELYGVSTYFTMTTITTVGYGDISGTTTIEKIICIFLHLIGVLSYSFAAGSSGDNDGGSAENELLARAIIISKL